nr:antigen 7H8/2 - malaria parasite (Plasmodium falciparum) (fragments) [Plasmodium falciparum]
FLKSEFMKVYRNI